MTSSWTPPALDDLRLDRDNAIECTISAIWAVEYLKTLNRQPSGGADAWEGMNMDLTVDMLNTTLPHDYPVPDKRQATSWFLDKMLPANLTDLQAPISGFYWNMAGATTSQCQPKLCQNIHWPGDPEVMGPGVWISYCMEAGLSTLFFVVIMTANIVGHHRLSSPWSTIVKPFTRSVETFLDATLVFVLAMLAAAFVRYVSILFGEIDDDASTIPLFLSVYFSLFACFPTMLLFAISSPVPEPTKEKRLRQDQGRMVRRVLWFCVVVLIIVLVALSSVAVFPRYVSDYDDSNAQQVMMTESLWSTYCEDNESREHLDTLVKLGLGFFISYGLVCLIYACIHSFPCPCWKKLRNGRSGPWMRLCLQLSVSLACLACMWVTLVYGYLYRNCNQIHDGEGQWTFGQVLSLATWAPVVITLFTTNLHAGKAKVKRGLSLHRPDGRGWRRKDRDAEPGTTDDTLLDLPAPALKRSWTK